MVGYHRYMDDGIVFCSDRALAETALSAARSAAESLRLSLHPKKTHLNRISQPFVFCKMRFTRCCDGGARCNVRKQQSRRAVKHAKAVARLARATGAIDVAPVEASLRGYLGRGDADLGWLADKAFE